MPEQTATPAPATPEGEIASRLAQAEPVIRKNVMWALGAGVVPLPFLDIAAVTAVNLKMLREISGIYGVTFSEGLVKKIAYSLLTSVGIIGLGSAVGGSLAKLLPAVGTTLGVVSVPIVSAAFTHALGKVLVMHFESGGTLLDFNPAAMRTYFKQEFEKAKTTVAQMHSDSQKSGAKVA